nr:Down syndrome cell adhesion molecule-like protein 1 homolog [Parasteatoda tepidariorum]
MKLITFIIVMFSQQMVLKKSVFAASIPVLHPLHFPPELILGDSLDMVCSLKRGKIPITFEWKLNNKKISDIFGVVINTSERKSSFSIQKIQYEHIGNYSCKAYNDDGFDEVSAELKVEGIVSNICK